MRRRIHCIKDAIALVDKIDPERDEDFCYALNEMTRFLDTTDKELADLLDISRPTLERWKAGKNFPYRLLRKPALEFIRKRLKEQ